MRRYPPEFVTGVPSFLDAAQPPPSNDELTRAKACRTEFLMPEQKEPYMADIIRAFRLIRGASNYIEIGTYDKGNLAYISRLVGPTARMIDIDVEARPAQKAKLEQRLLPGQKLFTLVADSSLESTVEKAAAFLDGAAADAIFIDGNHIAEYVISDYSLYSRLVRPGGLILFHDVYWTGDEKFYGVSQALQQIDRFSPIYVVWGADDPVHRYFPQMTRETFWGGVGIIRKPS